MNRFPIHNATLWVLGGLVWAAWAAGPSLEQASGNPRAAMAASRDTNSPTEVSFAGVQGTVRGIMCPDYVSPGVPCNREPIPRCTVGVAFVDALADAAVSSEALFAPLRVFRGISNEQGRYVVDSIPLSFDGQRVIVSATAEGFETASVDTTVWTGISSVVDLLIHPNYVIEVSLDVPRKSAATGPVSYSEPDQVLSLYLERGQKVAIEAYLLNGRRDGRLNTERIFEPGTYRFSLSDKRLGNGVVIVRVRGEDFSEVRMITLNGPK